MYKRVVLAYFAGRADGKGGSIRCARFLQIHKSAVSAWPEIIPEGSAYKLESWTRGALKVDPALYGNEKPAAAA